MVPFLVTGLMHFALKGACTFYVKGVDYKYIKCTHDSATSMTRKGTFCNVFVSYAVVYGYDVFVL